MSKRFLIIITLCIINPLFIKGQFDGGSGDGVDITRTFSLLNGTTVTSIYSGGSGDGIGWNAAYSLLNGSELVSIFTGGMNDGYDNSKVLSLLDGREAFMLFQGGNNDGYSKAMASSLLNGVEVASIYGGGSGDGYHSLFIEGPLNMCIVFNTNDDGIGSLRYTVGCTLMGGNVTFDPMFNNTTIVVDSAIVINKDINILPNPDHNIVLSGTGVPMTMDILSDIQLEIGGLVIMGTQSATGIVRNRGNLRISDLHIKGDGTEGKVFLNLGTVEILAGKDLRITPN